MQTDTKSAFNPALETQFETIKCSKEDKLAIITLNRPEDGNALNLQMAAELSEAALACEHDASIKAVLINASGRFFCVGGDVKAMLGFGDKIKQQLKKMADDLHQAISTFARMESPIIIAVNGTAAGAGMSLAAIGDLVIACESASFTMAYTKVGLSPDGSSSWYLPRLIGLRKTQELMYTNRVLNAVEAEQWGLVTRVVPDTEVFASAKDIASNIANGASQSNRNVKKLLLQSSQNSLETQMEIEARYISACAGSANGQEGILAFTEKRQAEFK